SLFRGHCKRLVTDDVNPPLQEGLCYRCMRVVRSHDGDGFYPVGTGRFGCRHLLVGSVRAVGCEAEVTTRLPRADRIGRQCAGHQLEMIVQARGDPVHGAYEGVAPATDHSQANSFHEACSSDRAMSGMPALWPSPGASRTTACGVSRCMSEQFTSWRAQAAALSR